MKELILGGLRCRLAGGVDREGGGDGPLVVLMHGFGAPGDDLVPLWRAVDAPRDARFLFPEAPLQLPRAYGAGRAWWMIDMDALERARARGEQRDLARGVPPGMPEAREKARAMLREAREKLAPSSIVLGGFSQGAMLACDVALRDDAPLAGLALMSGTLVAEDEWAPLMPARRGLRVVQSHGRADPILPFAAAERLRALLTGAGMNVTWLPFNGGHEIPPSVLDALGALVRDQP